MKGWMSFFFAVLLALLNRAPADRTFDVARIVVAPAETLSVTHQGTGKAVVFIPGMLGGAFSFRKVAQQLSADGGRVLIIDPLGTGGSSRPSRANYSMQAQAVRVAAVLDSMGIEQALVVGHSAGVPVALRLALLRPALVSYVVAVSGNASEKYSASNVRMAVRLAPILRLFGGARKAEQRVISGLREHSVDQSWITSDVVASYTAPYRNDLGGSLRVLSAVASSKEPFRLLGRLSELRAPVLLLYGTGARKPSVKEDDLAAFQAALPQMRVDTLAGVGAMVQEERPDLLVAAIRAAAR